MYRVTLHVHMYMVGSLDHMHALASKDLLSLVNYLHIRTKNAILLLGEQSEPHTVVFNRDFA